LKNEKPIRISKYFYSYLAYVRAVTDKNNIIPQKQTNVMHVYAMNSRIMTGLYMIYCSRFNIF